MRSVLKLMGRETYITVFDCNERCLVYLLTCNKCKEQCVRQIIDQLQSRLNNCKRDCKKYGQGASASYMYAKTFFNHFYTSSYTSGFLENISLTFIDKTDFFDPLKREDYWRSTVKTMAPFGLNIEAYVKEFYYQCFEHLY